MHLILGLTFYRYFLRTTKRLFKALFAEDIEVLYPKEEILIASDGKWQEINAYECCNYIPTTTTTTTAAPTTTTTTTVGG